MQENLLSFAHNYWKNLLNPGDTVIDATCGNGNDTLFLAQTVLREENGLVLGLDVQQAAIAKTWALLRENLSLNTLDRVQLFHQSHEQFPQMAYLHPIKLIVYNLGYLPGSDKQITTLKGSTMSSLKAALDLISAKGCISIMCYPGHKQGAEEESSVVAFASLLDPKEWNVSRHSWVNRRDAPNLILLTKNK